MSSGDIEGGNPSAQMLRLANGSRAKPRGRFRWSAATRHGGCAEMWHGMTTAVPPLANR
jgi:hypothetical protein